MDEPQAQDGDLQRLVPANLKPRSKAEELLLKNVTTGVTANCVKLDYKGDDPNKADDWTEDRQIRAELLAWLCTNGQARRHIHPHGIFVYGADIVGPLDLAYASFPFQLNLQNCRVREDVNLLKTEVSEFTLSGSLVQGIMADGLVAKNVFLRNGFAANGETRLSGAQIGGDLDCGGGHFSKGLHADGIVVNGTVFLVDGFTANGAVRLPLAQIGGNLDCNSATITNERGSALQADGISVKGAVFLSNGFTTKGKVWLPGAQIGGQLYCDGGHFTDARPDGYALLAERAVVKSSVFFTKGFIADGRVHLDGIQIGGDFNCYEGSFQNAILKLTDASAATLNDSGLNDSDLRTPTKWPQPGNLYMDGFTYGRISSDGKINVEKRLDNWLTLQPPSPFHPQPYMQLAKVLRESGDREGAKKVLIEMEDRARKDDTLGPVVRPLLRLTIGYGYDPLRAFWWAAGLSAVGWVIYRRSYLAGSISPTEEKAHEEFKKPGGGIPAHYPKFSPLIYSVENSLPLVKLGQGGKWQPDPPGQDIPTQIRLATEFAYRPKLQWLRARLRSTLQFLSRGFSALWDHAPDWLRNLCAWFAAKTTSRRFVMWFLWFQILFGWLVATLFVAGVTGLVRKE